MAIEKRIALVTGANRGIGYEACRQLADAGMQVILTSRDTAKGEAAAQVLKAEGKDVRFHQLDVTDENSVAKLLQIVKAEYGRLDVLVNNAGVYLDEGVSVFDVDMATVRTTLEINFYGTMNMSRAFVPLMREQGYGRVVNVSSESGQLATMGAGNPSYSISKTAMNALTRIVAAEVKRYGNIKVNAMCPGWVRTDMGGANADRSVEEGADTLVWLATLAEDGVSGGFFQDRKAIKW